MLLLLFFIIQWYKCGAAYIKASQKRHEAFLIAKLPTLQEVPKKTPDVWVLCAHHTGNRCPTLGLLMPNAWSLSAHLMGKTDHLMVYDRT